MNMKIPNIENMKTEELEAFEQSIIAELQYRDTSAYTEGST